MGTRVTRGPARRLAAAGLALVLTAIAAVATVAYAGGALPEATAALRSDHLVRVEVGRWITFTPQPRAPGLQSMRPPGAPTGLAIYPGALVDPTAYAPVARRIAEAGHPVVIMPVALRLAILEVEAAVPLPVAFPEVRRWAVGGHSLGGVAAARYAHAHPDRVAGVVLWASFTDDAHSLADLGLPVVSISGTVDGYVTPALIRATRLALPPTTRFVAIDGGNHLQFGAYRYQLNDPPATISRDEQQREVAAATVAFLDALGAP